MKTINFLMAILLTLSFMSCNAQKNDKKIDVAALPAVAQELIKSNFADEQIKAVEQDNDGYEVKFKGGASIDFNTAGQWKEIDCERNAVPDAVVPQQIKDYAAKNYADKKIVKIECNSYGYEIEFDNGVEIKFDKDFNATIDK
jgi:hypothetical protein